MDSMTAAKKQTKPEAKQDTKPAVQPSITTPAATAQTTKPEPQPSRQQTTVAKLIDAWKARGIDVSKLEQVQDGKFLLLRLPNFPTIRIGPSGGGDLPEIGSYAKFFDAAVIGDQLLAKKKARDAKKQVANVQAPKPTTPAPQGQTAKAKETPTARKQKADAELERQLQHA